MSQAKPILYSYYRSSCTYRVRIALNLKNIAYDCRIVNILKGEQFSDDLKKLNPKREVPVLVIGDKILAQSLPIIEYVDETIPSGLKLLPSDSYRRYQTRMISEIICSGIQPLQNTSVMNKIGETKAEWAAHFISVGFDALELALKETSGKYCVGDELSLADCCIVPQVYNARRFKVDLAKYPLIAKIDKELNEIEAFKNAHPSAQIDCPESEKAAPQPSH